MWLLESKEAFQGRRFWLRPGKTYLFGRTAAEPGQVAISHNTISRKHITITVGSVAAGGAQSVSTRSSVLIEDLATKTGTIVNGQRIKGSKYVVPGDEAEMTMGKCPSIFRLRWFPVGFTFSFTGRELETRPMRSLQERFEQLDIKLLFDYSTQCTSHVISKKRNTAKGLQALISGKYIVTDSFLDAVAAAAEARDDDDSGSSPLEKDFDKYWPNALEHLPPPGSEPVQYPDEIYAPDNGRKAVFEGYTFVFYDQTQYHNLLAPITEGGGKATLRAVTPKQTTVDEFVGYVKEMAGEKGLGSFDDDSEGKGVVLVRYLPAKCDLTGWYTDLLTNVSLRLDHRPIEQNEFLEAILIKDASKLRRPLEIDSSGVDQEESCSRPLESATQPVQVAAAAREISTESQLGPTPRRDGARRPAKKRFAGFDDDDTMKDLDIDMNDAQPAPTTRHAVSQEGAPSQEEEDALFVSQESDAPGSRDIVTSRSQRKRTTDAIPEDDLMKGIAPATARFKRQRLDEVFAPPIREPEPEARTEAAVASKTEGKKKAKEELNVLAVAAKNREEAEARARAEEEDLAKLPDDVDLAEIRRLNIVEEMELRRPDAMAQATRAQDISSGRWKPKWNGVKNFKKFRRRGEATGRQPARVIVALTEVKNKEFGVGDNYWLEDEGSHQKRGHHDRHSLETQARPQQARQRYDGALGSDSAEEDSDEDNGDSIPDSEPSRRGPAQRQDGTASRQGKRSAPEAASSERPPAKRARSMQSVEVADSDGSDDSDDELKFRFGKRR